MATKTMILGNSSNIVNLTANGNVVGTNIKNKGNSTTPIYFDENGIAQECSGIGGELLDVIPIEKGGTGGDSALSALQNLGLSQSIVGIKRNGGTSMDSVTVKTATYTNVGSITLEEGYIYFLTVIVRFSSNTTGLRRIHLTDTKASSDALNVISTDYSYAGSSYVYCHISVCLAGGRTLYITAYQNSGSSLTAVPRISYLAVLPATGEVSDDSDSEASS